MWRPATPADDEENVAMCLALYREDPAPGITKVTPGLVRETLALFERQPARGRALVAQVGDRIAGYAFLVPFWSNGVGGEVCEVDELYVRAERRRDGLGSVLFRAIETGCLGAFACIALGVSPENTRARRLYERPGFRAAGTTMVRRRAGWGAGR